MDYFRGMRAEAGSLRALGSSCVAFLRKVAAAERPASGVPGWLWQSGPLIERLLDAAGRPATPT
jgi:hypothetical protein